MVRVTFEYMDAYSHGKWNQQQCIVSSVEEAIKIYGLGVDCDYHILSVEDLNEDSFRRPTTDNQLVRAGQQNVAESSLNTGLF